MIFKEKWALGQVEQAQAAIFFIVSEVMEVHP
jgi:hypothetical protein